MGKRKEGALSVSVGVFSFLVPHDSLARSGRITGGPDWGKPSENLAPPHSQLIRSRFGPVW